MNYIQINSIIEKNYLILKNLGKVLYSSIQSEMQKEEKFKVQDCIDYLNILLLEANITIYKQLEYFLKTKIQPAPDEWDRKYNVDFFIKINDKYIGLQIKPVNQGIQLAEVFKEKKIQLDSHKVFEEKFKGKVFYVFSTNVNGKKTIINPEVIDEIKEEIKRLKTKE